MFTNLQSGRFVVAVSGGVDSVVLLDLLRRQPQLQLIVAHFDHGIREDSEQDKLLAQNLAGQYGIPFVYDEGKLGPKASEATARAARYDFLHSVRTKSQAKAIITAHHQDDVLETALLNLMRGTGRRGMSSLGSTDVVKRPLLHVPKKRLVDYARANGLVWREDTTNSDQRYKRNYVRAQLVPMLTPMQRHELLAHIKHTHQVNKQIELELINHLHVQPGAQILSRSYFIMLPHAVALELLAAWLRYNDIRDFNRPGLNRIVVASKTYRPGQTIDVNNHYAIEVNHTNLALKARDR